MEDFVVKEEHVWDPGAVLEIDESCLPPGLITSVIDEALQKGAACPPGFRHCFVKLERLELGEVPRKMCIKEELLLKASHEDSEVESIDNLYADHIVKQELVLGPERPYRPNVNLTTCSRVTATTNPHQATGPNSAAPTIKECFVRLERLRETSNTRKPSVLLKQNTAKQPYICDVCGKVCKFRHIIIRHLRYHSLDTIENSQIAKKVQKPYNCEICGKSLSSSMTLKRHLKIHVGVERYSCEICGKKFMEAGDYKRHTLIHSKNKPEFLYDICNNTFASVSNLKVHKRNVHLGLKLYSCDVCEMKYTTFDNLKKHKNRHFEEKPYICDICNKGFKRLDLLKFHKSSHIRFTCDVCENTYTRRYQLNTHKLLHSNKPVCRVCNKIFETSSDLDDHRRTYQTPYSCVICKKLFCEFRYFQKHKQRTHGVGKRYFCHICRKDFSLPDELSSHMLDHKEGYSCGVCHENFADNLAMRKHKKTHKA